MSSGKAKEFETYARDCVKLAKQDNVSRSVTALRAREGGLPALLTLTALTGSQRLWASDL